MPSPKPPKLGILLPTRGLLLKGSTARPFDKLRVSGEKTERSRRVEQPTPSPLKGEGQDGDESPLDTSPLFSMARQAEEAGLSSVWVGDSLLAKPRLEPLATLAALAVATKKVRLGTAVLLAPLRNPAQLAQMAATVDVLSGGRLDMGIGVGGAFTPAQQHEWLTVGLSPKERGSRMTELMQACRLLWTQDNVMFKGRFYSLEEASLGPKPAQPGGVPMLLACHYATGSQAQYQRAALYADGVMGISDSPENYARVLESVRELTAKTGRDPLKMRTAFYMTVNINGDRDAAFKDADRFIRSYYGQNFWTDKWGPFGPAEEVAKRVLKYARAGAQEIVLRFASINNQQAQLEAFMKEVLPALR